MSKAEITWTGEAKDYRVGPTTFRQNRSETIEDDATIAYCKNVFGFVVAMKAEAPKPKATAKIETEEPAAAEEAPAPERSSFGKKR